MRLARWIGLVTLVAGASAHAADEGDLSGRARAMAAARSPESAAAPFAAHVDPTMIPASAFGGPPAALERSVPCALGLSPVCYDVRDRGLVYRGARDFMPHVEGLTAEGVALRPARGIRRYRFR
jgi:hypothetical protein